MEQLQERLERIGRQIEGLLAERGRLQRELEQARQRIWDLEAQAEQFQEERNRQEESIKMLKLAKVLQPEGIDRKDIKLKVNELVREIDRCIDMLNA
jgi:chromosome segregation ATPase